MNEEELHKLQFRRDWQLKSVNKVKAELAKLTLHYEVMQSELRELEEKLNAVSTPR